MAQEIFTKAQVNVAQLADEILAGISKLLIKYNDNDVLDGSIEFILGQPTNNLIINFNQALSGGESASLSVIVAAHTPIINYVSPNDPDIETSISGFSGYSGISGLGLSGVSGYSGVSGFSGQDGIGTSGFSGINGVSGYSGISGYSGRSGYSGYSGQNGNSGFSGVSGFSGYSGDSGFSGNAGTSGFSGFSGVSGFSGQDGIGTSGFSGYSGDSGFSGRSGYSGVSGFSGYSGVSGFSGQGFSGVSGFSGNSTSGFSGYSGISGFSGRSGYSGYSGISGFATVFGTAYTYAESVGQSNTTSSTLQTKITMTTASLELGNYYLGWYMEIRGLSTSKDIIIRIDDGITTYSNTNIEPRDTTNWFPVSGFIQVTASGIKNFYIRWASEAGTTASIRNARLTLWRVA